MDEGRLGSLFFSLNPLHQDIHYIAHHALLCSGGLIALPEREWAQCLYSFCLIVLKVTIQRAETHVSSSTRFIWYLKSSSVG